MYYSLLKGRREHLSHGQHGNLNTCFLQMVYATRPLIYLFYLKNEDYDTLSNRNLQPYNPCAYLQMLLSQYDNQHKDFFYLYSANLLYQRHVGYDMMNSCLF